MTNQTQAQTNLIDYTVATFAGVVTAGPAGLLAAPLAMRFCKGRFPQKKWLAWAGIGVVAAPALLGVQTAVFGTADTQPQVAEVTEEVAPAPVVPAEPQLDQFGMTPDQAAVAKDGWIQCRLNLREEFPGGIRFGQHDRNWLGDGRVDVNMMIEVKTPYGWQEGAVNCQTQDGRVTAFNF